MLIDVSPTADQSVSTILRLIDQPGSNVTRLRQGIYLVGSLVQTSVSQSGTNFNEYPYGLSVEACGIADSVDQIIEKCPELQYTGRQFFLTVIPVLKGNQPETNGFNWKSWGPYIGDQIPTKEYLYDEPVVNQVFVYHIYERNR